MRVEDCSGEVKDSNFIAETLIVAIEHVGADKVVEVIVDNEPICKSTSLVGES